MNVIVDDDGVVRIFFEGRQDRAEQMQVSTAGCSMLEERHLPQAKAWLAEVARRHQLQGTCARIPLKSVRGLVMGFVPDRGLGLQRLQACILAAGTSLA